MILLAHLEWQPLVVFLLVQHWAIGIDLSIERLLQRMRFKVYMWYHIGLCNLFIQTSPVGLATKVVLDQFIFAPFFIAGKS